MGNDYNGKEHKQADQWNCLDRREFSDGLAEERYAA
jgi:hypothetical protein